MADPAARRARLRQLALAVHGPCPVCTGSGLALGLTPWCGEDCTLESCGVQGTCWLCGGSGVRPTVARRPPPEG